MKIKKKLKDLTPKEYRDWNLNNCIDNDNCICDTCPFESVNCFLNSKNIWINHKDIYSDEFLNQEIEIEVPDDILDRKEKEYLESVIKPFKNIVKNISKQEMHDNYEYISICVSTPADIGYYYGNRKHILLPYFKRGTMYKNMKSVIEYSLEELGL